MSEARGSGFGRSVALALLVAALLAALGWVVFTRFVAVPATAVAPPVQPAPPPPVPPTPPPLAAEAPVRLETVARAVRGQAERSQGSRWVPLSQGDKLAVSESVRTGAGGRVELEVGGADSRVTLPERSEVGISEVTEVVHRLKLRKGRIQVAYDKRGERVLKVEGEGGSVAETRAATFVMSSTGVAVAVATEKGSVDLAAGGKTVEVSAGKQAVSLAGKAPSAAEEIPVEALLKVARAADRDDVCVALKGKARPGAEVTVDGEPVVVSSDGTFKARVMRRAKLAAVEVVTREVGGATRRAEVACAQRGEPKAEVKVDWNAQP